MWLQLSILRQQILFSSTFAHQSGLRTWFSIRFYRLRVPCYADFSITCRAIAKTGTNQSLTHTRIMHGTAIMWKAERTFTSTLILRFNTLPSKMPSSLTLTLVPSAQSPITCRLIYNICSWKCSRGLVWCKSWLNTSLAWCVIHLCSVFVMNSLACISYLNGTAQSELD